MSAAATHPTLLQVDPTGIPRELVDDPSWYPAIIRPKANKPGKYDKIPGDPATGKPATWSDPATRCTFGVAFMAHQSGRFPGIGYMMDADAGVIGIDLDDSIDPDGTVKPWAQQIVDAFPGAYWERSISGAGLRGFCRGSLPVGGCRTKIDGCSVELYADERFLVVTGQAIRPVDELPELQGAVDALHERLSAGRERSSGSAIVTGLTGPIDSLSPEALDVLGDVLGGRFAAQMATIWGREDITTQGVSEQDWALECETAYHAIRRGHADEALARIVEEVVRAGPYREKWDEPRGKATWLAQDVANAIATVQKRLAARSESIQDLDVEDTATPAPPADETCAQKVFRLGRALAQEKAAHARTRAVNAVQATVIRAHNRVEGELRAELERLNREKYAEWRLRRSKMKSAQVDTFIALTRIGTKRAEWLDKDAPVITGQNIGDELGAHESTARANADAVCSLPGSPIKRVTKYRTDGMRGQLTTYELAVRDPVEILERMVVVAEALDQSPSARPRPRQCPVHPDAGTKTVCAAAGCDVILSERPATPSPGVEPLCVEVTRIEPKPPTVDVPVLIPVQHPRIGGPNPEPNGDGHHDVDRAAAELVTIKVAASNGHTNGHQNGHGTNGAVLTKPPPWRCTFADCRAFERYRGGGGAWVCSGCARPAALDGWRD